MCFIFLSISGLDISPRELALLCQKVCVAAYLFTEVKFTSALFVNSKIWYGAARD